MVRLQQQLQQPNQHLDQHPRPSQQQDQDQPSQRVTAPTTTNTVLIGLPLVNVARIQLIWINIVANHVDYAAVVEAEEVAPMQVLIATIGRNMAIADQIMRIWVNHVEKHVAFADIHQYQRTKNSENKIQTVIFVYKLLIDFNRE